MNWYLIISFAIVVIVLIVFLVKRNIKDEESVEHQLNHDYKKTKDEEGDIDVE